MGMAASTGADDTDTAVLDTEGETATDENQPPQDDDAAGNTGDDVDPEGGTTDEAADGDGAGDDEVVISFGEESPTSEEDESRAPPWVRELRKQDREKARALRERDRQLREKDAEIARLKGQADPASGDPGPKPTLESCDFDADKFADKLEAWHTRKREHDDQQAKRTQAEEQQRAQWKNRIDAVDKAASELKVKDHAEATEAVEAQFSPVQLGIVLGGPDDPKASAQLRYALGKNPKKLKELASIQDPVKFAFAVAKLETQLKVTPRKAAPLPDRQVRSNVAGAAVVDSEYERLSAEADRTGDRTKVAAYLRQKQQNSRGK